MGFKSAIKALTPTSIWDRAQRARGWLNKPPPPSARTYQGVSTIHSVRELHEGPFAEAYDRHWRLDPYNAESNGNRMRMRAYNICHFAQKSLRIPGDFVVAGVAWGVVARVMFDVLDWQSQGRILHLIDPFLGVDNSQQRVRLEKYNDDPELVRRQFPTGSCVAFHREFIPAALQNLSSIAFAYLNTGDHQSEAESLPLLFTRVANGGSIVIDSYAVGPGYQKIYDPALSGHNPFVLPTGQGVIIL